jgi:hypothetical protein
MSCSCTLEPRDLLKASVSLVKQLTCIQPLSPLKFSPQLMQLGARTLQRRLVVGNVKVYQQG